MSSKVSKDYLVQRYVQDRLSIRQVAEEVGVSSSVIQRTLVTYGIPAHRMKGFSKSSEWRQKLAQSKIGRWSGENNPNWKGGVSLGRPRGLSQERYWSRSVKRRDNFICQSCGLDGKVECSHCGLRPEMHSDHIKSWQDHPELRHELSNGRTLCAKCHRKTLGK